jgi:hypothetical protein
MGYLQSLANTRAIPGKGQTVVLSVAANRRYAVYFYVILRSPRLPQDDIWAK